MITDDPDPSVQLSVDPVVLDATSLSTFAVVWGTATLMHLLAFHFWARTWQGWLLVLTVGLVLMRPTSLQRFTAMIAASLANLCNSLPFVPNHILFEGIIHLTILTAVGGHVWKHRADVRARFRQVEWNRLILPALLLSGYVILLMVVKHEHIGGLTTALLLIYFGRNSLPELSSPACFRDISDSFSGVIRWELAIMYLWSVVQKLNTDYFNPSVSCAVQMQRELQELLHLPASPEVVQPLYIWGSIVLEATIPLLLIVPITRRLGFVLALLFHFWLALHPFPGIYSFSALILASLVVFLPESRRQLLVALWGRQRERLARLVPALANPAMLGGAVIGVFYVLGISSSIVYTLGGENRSSFQIVNTIGLVAFLVWGMWLGSSYLFVYRRPVTADDTPLPAIRWTAACFGLVLVFANGLNPWIGLKTQTSFAMFSNLRTEFEPNHFFLRKFDGFDYQRDMVEILESTPDLLVPPKHPTGIEQFANPGAIMPFFELRRLLSRVDGDVTVTILRGGKIELMQRTGGEVTHADAFAPPTLLERKFLWFRRHLHWHGPMHCTH